MRIILFLLLFLGFSNLSFSQIHFSGNINLEGFYSNNEELPFWFYANQRGRVSKETNFSGWITGKMNYNISRLSSLEVGAGILYQDDYLNEDYIDELYADFKYSWIQIIAGRKQEKMLYNGLSATNENFAWSLNSRPMPGIQFQTSRPVYLNHNKTLGLEFSWEEYVMGNDRFVKGTRLHGKSIYLVSEFDKDWRLKIGIRHFAQWGGDSPESGKQPEGFSDYLRIIGGREGGENAVNGDQINVAGSHLGTYEIYLTKRFTDLRFQFIYNHFFEDGTGSRYANFPDGRYGFYFEKIEEKSLFQSWIYEFYYTRNQSINSSAPHKNDNYFNNFLTYHSGWTYQRRIIGVPFFDYDENKDRVIGNKFLAHHIGLAGNISNNFVSYPYKLLATYIRKDGSYVKRYIPNRDEIYFSCEIGLVQKPFEIQLQLGAEYSNIAKPIYGAGVKISKQF